MKKGTKNIAFYVIMLVIFGSLMYLIIQKGESHQAERVIVSVYETPTNLSEGLSVFYHLVMEHIQSPLGILFLQIMVILSCCRILGHLFAKIGQPSVIGEILAGIVLGPSILGHWFPDISGFLFPANSLDNISMLSQFGLILFMFVIGMELDISEVRKRLKETILISHTSTIIPFFLGIVMAYFIYDDYADKGTPFLSFALFIGIAMSITAFPVLARIIQEKGLTKSHLGTISLASAANGDITAWCLLAVVIAIVQAGSILSAVYNILFSALYLLIMFFVIRPFLRMVGQVYHNEEVIDKRMVTFMFLILIASSLLTEVLGLHALFGAFMAGMVMPTDIKFRKILVEKVESVSLSLFLPLFFVSMGLKTEVGLLNTPELWGLCIIFILVAIIGKFGSATLSARFVGENWKNSLYIGAFMNTRGLMELVVLSIGYQMNILPPSIFVMLVLMTLITTFMTTPLLLFIKSCFRFRYKIISLKKKEHFKVLLSFGRAGNGQIMLNVAQQLFSKGENKLEVTALHFTLGSDINPLQINSFETVSFAPILQEAEKLGVDIHTRYEMSRNIGHDVSMVTNEGGFDFLLVGIGIAWSNLPNDIAATQFRESIKERYFKPLEAAESLFVSNELLKDKTKTFIEEAHCPVGVFINRGFERASRVLVILRSDEDEYLLPYAETLLKSTSGTMNILDLSKKEITAELLGRHNFMIISYHTWENISEERRDTLQHIPSTLIISNPLIER
jgi:Kef-type K+ transport system membrane component KefB